MNLSSLVKFIPSSKASWTDLDSWTDDTKFATAKAIKDSQYIPRRISRTISSSEIMWMYVTPIEIIPAPWVGKAISIEQWVLSYKRWTVSYTWGWTVIMAYWNWTDWAVSQWSWTISNSIINWVSSSINSKISPNSPATVENSSVNLKNWTAAFATWDWTCILTVFYSIINV